mgnify:CR=1 FL=1
MKKVMITLSSIDAVKVFVNEINKFVDEELDPLIAKTEMFLMNAIAALDEATANIFAHKSEFIGNQGEQSVISFIKENFPFLIL